MQYEAHRDLKLRFRKVKGIAGRFLPFALKLGLARRSTKFSYLLLDDGEFEVRDYLGDCRVRVNARNEIERVLITGQYEPEVVALIREWVKPGDFVADVGANVGAITLALAKQVGPDGCVTSFEPGPPFFEKLRQNLRLNPECEKVVRPQPLGVSSSVGELHWGEDVVFPGNAHLLGKRGTKVPVTTLDHFFGDSLERLDFVKIDVEGMEWEVLKGAEQTLRKHKPVILYETFLPFEQMTSGDIRKRAADFLTGLGYELYHADSTRPLRRAVYPNLSANTLAVPTDRN